MNRFAGTRRRFCVLGVACLFVACETTVEPVLPSSCEEEGITHEAVATPTTWSAANGPYHVRSRLVVTAPLVIEAGATVCGAPSSAIDVHTGGALIAVGTAALPVLFTAEHTGAGWGGIEVNYADSVRLDYATIEYANHGVLGFVSDLVVSRTELRRIAGVGIQISGTGTVSDVTMDSVDTGVHVDRAPSVILRRVAVRRFATRGIFVWRSPVHFEDVLIEDGSGIGLSIEGTSGSELSTFHRLSVRGVDGRGVYLGAIGVRLTSCEIADNSKAGVIVGMADVSIRHCNLSGNGGTGVENGWLGHMDARDNWWGDPGGPHGPNGDGVSGLVVYEPYLTAPVDITVMQTAGRTLDSQEGLDHGSES